MEEKEEKRKRYWPWVVFLAIPAGIFFAASTADELYPIFQELREFYPMASEVDDCIKDQKKPVADMGFNSDFSCVVEVAAKYYEDDPGRSVEFCMSYSNSDLGEQFLKTSCKSLILKQIEEQKTSP